MFNVLVAALNLFYLILKSLFLLFKNCTINQNSKRKLHKFDRQFKSRTGPMQPPPPAF